MTRPRKRYPDEAPVFRVTWSDGRSFHAEGLVSSLGKVAVFLDMFEIVIHPSFYGGKIEPITRAAREMLRICR